MGKGMNNSIKKGVVVAVILLFFSVSVIPSTGNRVFFDDTTPPVTTCTLEPPEPNGLNGWYVDYVEVTLNATDDISGVNVTYYRINNGSWIGYAESFELYESNYYTIEFYSVDNAGNEEDAKNTSCKLDNKPPITTYTLDPLEPDGDNGWYVSNVTMILSASDDMSGVYLICPAPVVILTEDSSEVTFFSIDYAGNVENWKSITVTIDYTPPTIEITWEVFGNFICGWQVIFTATCSDATSGMDYVEFYLNEGLMFTAPAAPFEWIIEWSSALKSFTLKVVAHDIAGNSANATLNLSEIQSSNPMWLPRLLERFPLLNNLIKLFMERWRV